MQLSRLAWLVLCGVAVVLVPGVRAQRDGARSSRESDIVYGRKFGLALTMEAFTPAKRNGLGVVWVVSSSGMSSREQTLQDTFSRRIAPLLDRGFTVFAVILGSAPIFNLEDQLGDVTRAVRSVRHDAGRFHVDPRRLAIAGSSAGGLLALALAMNGDDGDPGALDPIERVGSRVQAAGAFFAPTDLLNFGAIDAAVVDMMLQRSGVVDPSFQFYETEPGPQARRPVTARDRVLSRLRDLSPITHVTPGDPPTILIHGDQDKAVPLQQSQRLHERLVAADVPVRLVVRQGVGHAYPGWESDTALVAEWFVQYLRAP